MSKLTCLSCKHHKHYSGDCLACHEYDRWEGKEGKAYVQLLDSERRPMAEASFSEVVDSFERADKQREKDTVSQIAALKHERAEWQSRAEGLAKALEAAPWSERLWCNVCSSHAEECGCSPSVGERAKQKALAGCRKGGE